MSTPEWGSKAEYADDLEERETDTEQLENAISVIQSECSFVYDEPDAGAKLDQLIRDAREFYEVDPKGWESLLNDTRQQLLKDDESKPEDALRAAITKGTELMD